jgi:hypothetical protein
VGFFRSGGTNNSNDEIQGSLYCGGFATFGRDDVIEGLGRKSRSPLGMAKQRNMQPQRQRQKVAVTALADFLSLQF